MRKYALRRLASAVPTLFGITVLIFVAMRVLPGDPVAMIASEGQGPYALRAEEPAKARATLGLDKPYYLPPARVLSARHAAAARALAEAAAANASAHEAGAAALKRRLVAGDQAAAKAEVDAMWQHVSRTYQSLQALEVAWNELTVRVSES